MANWAASRAARLFVERWRPLGVVCALALALAASAASLSCESDSVTADCPAMPQIDPTTGEVVEPSEWSEGPGPGGALNRWQTETEKTHPECITLPGAAGGAAP